MPFRRMRAIILPLCCNPLYAGDEPLESSQFIVAALRTAETADETQGPVVHTLDEIVVIGNASPAAGTLNLDQPSQIG